MILMIAYFSMLWRLAVLSLRLILDTRDTLVLFSLLRLPTPLCLRILIVALSLCLLKIIVTPLQFVHRKGVEEGRSDAQPFACSFCVSSCTFVL
jgi:hypothetical protein